LEKLIGKAKVLLEALPYIKNFYGETFVIKYGGSAFTNEELRPLFAKDIVLLKYIGINPIIVHGGGPQISEFLKKLKISTEFFAGLRITTKDVMKIVEMVLCGYVNKDIVNLINIYGGNAVGISGKDGNLLFVKKVETKEYLDKLGISYEEDNLRDIGYVGEVIKVNPDILKKLIEDKFIPVVAPIGVGIDYKEGTSLTSYNINADLAAGKIAASLPARKLILLTDVEGLKLKRKDKENIFKFLNKKGYIVKENSIFDKDREILKIKDLDEDFYLISKFSLRLLKSFIEKGIIKGGMIPKLLSCKDALEKGVNKAHIIDGRIPHSILLEIFTKEGIGTEIIL